MTDPKHLLNLLWFSNATWLKTGYGLQTAIWSHRLAKAGYGVVVAAYRGLEGSPLADSAGIVHLPRVKEVHCNDCIWGHYLYAPMHFPDHRPTDVVFSLIDIFAMRADVWRQLPWAAWTPIDCSPVLQEERVQFAACRWPIAMSRFGEAEMKAIGLKPLYIPHGIDSTVFYPTDRLQARRNMLDKKLITRPIPDDAFLVVVVANNGISRRKNFSGLFESFQIFVQDHPDALLYVHADPTGVHGKPIDAMAAQLGLADKVIFPGPPTNDFTDAEDGRLRSSGAYLMTMGLPTDDHLRDVYNAADVKLMLSQGEGFGLSDVEAQMCGTPLVGTNFSASIELNFTGWKVNGPVYQPEGMERSYQMLPDVLEAAARLTEAYNVWKMEAMPALREATRQAALVYDVEKVLVDYFIPALDQIGEDLKRQPHQEWLRQRLNEGDRKVQLLPPSRVPQNREKRRERRAREKR